ncbi:Transporter, drug/metabolite exporter family [Bacillus thuringiensis serovar israelensis ATCC 35646]|nr:Transporter, drug/metabolite exporter family [Bacillus thuringiensis serovar israelensis ATCC 35646]
MLKLFTISIDYKKGDFIMPYFYVFLLLLTSLLWGGNFVVGKSLVDHASPMTLTNLRWMIAIVCLLPMVWFKEKKILPPRTAILPLILMGISGVALFNIFQFLALEKTSATNVGLISTLNAISIALFSVLFLKEKVNTLQILSMILSFFGVILVLLKGDFSLLFSLHFNSGDLWMIAAVCIWGIYSVCSKWATKTTTPLMARCTLVFSALFYYYRYIVSFTVSNIDTSFITSLLYTGLISTVLCMVFWNIGVQKLGATTSGIFLNFNPIFTAILAFIFLGEELTWIQILGTIVVVTGCYLFSHFKTVAVQPVRPLMRKHP